MSDGRWIGNAEQPVSRTAAMKTFEAWWLPGWTPDAATEWWSLEGSEVRARAPKLGADPMDALVCRLRAARRDYLRQLSADDIAQRIGAAINRWLDPYSPFLHQACRLIPAFTGYPEPAVRKGLATYLGSFRTENLRRLLRDELGNPEFLDGFRPRQAAPGMARATGPDLVLHSFAGNVPGLPAQSLVAATLVKAASLGKIASEEPVFAPLFLRSLADVDARLASCLAVTYWPGGEASTDEAAVTAFAEADTVVAYGSEPAIAAVRTLVPAGRRLIVYGHKLSFGVLTRECLREEALTDLAERAAYDVCRFDQQGCLSPHLFYVEAGGAADDRAFAAVLADALARFSGVVPRGRITRDEQAQLAELRRAQEFRAAGGRGAIYGSPGDDWAVLLAPMPEFSASCLNRAVWVKPLPDITALPGLLAPVRQYLQTAGVAATSERLETVASLLADVGLDRVCPLGQMGDPPPAWHHDGRFNLLDFLRFTDLEPESSAGRWEFVHPEEGLLGMGRRIPAPGGGSHA